MSEQVIAATEAKVDKKNKRIIELDILRGILVVFMLFDHLFYDFAYIFTTSFNIPRGSALYEFFSQFVLFNESEPRIIIRFIIVSLFFFTCGISTAFSRSNFKRGVIVLGAAVLLGVGSYVFSVLTDSYYTIFFGAVACLGLSILIYSLFHYIVVQKLKLDQEWKFLSLSFGMICLAIGCLFDVFNVTRLPEYVILNWETFIGVMTGEFTYGADWMPLFPYLGFLFIGSFCAQVLYPNKQSLIKFELKLPSRDQAHYIPNICWYYPVLYIKKTFAFVGRHALWFYVLHQVVYILVGGSILLLLGYSIVF